MGSNCKHKSELDKGDRISMPASALSRLVDLEVHSPMAFEIENRYSGRKSHCGVHDFSAEEGIIYIPYWNLGMTEGNVVTLRNACIPKGTYVKLQPHSLEFFDNSDLKAILELSLRNYCCLTVGDCISVIHKTQTYFIDIIDAKPERAILLIDTDCAVDFLFPNKTKKEYFCN